MDRGRGGEKGGPFPATLSKDVSPVVGVHCCEKIDPCIPASVRHAFRKSGVSDCHSNARVRPRKDYMQAMMNVWHLAHSHIKSLNALSVLGVVPSARDQST